MTQYPDLYALLTGELGTQAPTIDKIEALAQRIKAEHPGATHVVFFRNGHWTLLPIGPTQAVKRLEEAEGAILPHVQSVAKGKSEGRRPLAYCPI